MVEIEYPVRSGKKIRFPEVDKAGFFTLEKARKMVYPSLVEFFERLEEQLRPH